MNQPAVSLSARRERRKHRRISDAIAVRLHSTPGNEQLKGDWTGAPTHVVHLSHGGVEFTHDGEYTVGDITRLSLCFLPGTARQAQTVTLKARVLSADKKPCANGQRVRLRLQFIDVDHRSAALIDDHIQQTFKRCRLMDYKTG